MRLFKKDSDKETVSLWKREAKRLEKERNQFMAELEAVRNYKHDYEALIQKVSALKDAYTKAVKQMESLGTEYHNKLQHIADRN